MGYASFGQIGKRLGILLSDGGFICRIANGISSLQRQERDFVLNIPIVPRRRHHGAVSTGKSMNGRIGEVAMRRFGEAD